MRERPAERHRLTERQKRFADHYLETGNARRAAELAGYSASYASEARRQPAVEEYLRERLAKLDSQRVAGVEEVLEYLTSVLRGEDGEEGRKGERGASRMKAAELLGKRLGLFAETGGEEDIAPVYIVDDIPGEDGPA